MRLCVCETFNTKSRVTEGFNTIKNDPCYRGYMTPSAKHNRSNLWHFTYSWWSLNMKGKFMKGCKTKTETSRFTIHNWLRSCDHYRCSCDIPGYDLYRHTSMTLCVTSIDVPLTDEFGSSPSSCNKSRKLYPDKWRRNGFRDLFLWRKITL